MATRVGLFKIPSKKLNSRTLKTPVWCKIFGHRSYINQITDDFVSKFPNFRYPGNKGRFFNSKEAVENFFRGHVETLPGCMYTKFKVCIFSHFGAVGI